MTDKRVTISDIARESGASPTTVSLVLRDKGVIGQDTRERVLAAAQALGYERKNSKRSETTDTATVGLLFRAHSPYPQGGANGVNPFYSWVLTGMEATARTRRMNLLYGTLTVDDDNEIVDIPHHLLDQPLDGVIVVGTFTDEDIAGLRLPVSCPVVVVDAPGPSKRHDVVTTDNEGGTALATQHLIDAGHTHIGLVTRHVAHNANFAARERGYLATMAASGLEPVVGRVTHWDSTEALNQIFEQDARISALVCVNDQFALDVFSVLDQRGMQVPNDISLVGFDNTDHARAMRPGLTTLNVDKVGMGRFAITLLDHRLQWPDGAVTTVTLTPTLVQRGSVQ